MQCTRSCDTGLQHREIKCLDADQLPSQSCDADLRPDLRRTCNHHACPSTPLSSSSEPRDSHVSGRTGGGYGSRGEAGGRHRDHHSSQGTAAKPSYDYK